MFFSRRKSGQVEAQAYLRRICDLTTPNLPRIDDSRGDTRLNRTLPVLVVPWQVGTPLLDSTMTGLTRDISDRGLSLLLTQQLQVSEVVIGFWLPPQDDRPWFFLGEIRHQMQFGDGYWALGIEVMRRLTAAESGELTPIAIDYLRLSSHP